MTEEGTIGEKSSWSLPWLQYVWNFWVQARTLSMVTLKLVGTCIRCVSLLNQGAGPGRFRNTIIVPFFLADNQTKTLTPFRWAQISSPSCSPLVGNCTRYKYDCMRRRCLVEGLVFQSLPLEFTSPSNSDIQVPIHRHLLMQRSCTRDQSQVYSPLLSDLKYLSFTELNEEVSRALIDLGITKNDTLSHSCMVCSHLPLLSLFEPNSVGIYTNASQICHLRWWSESNYSWQHTFKFTSCHSSFQPHANLIASVDAVDTVTMISSLAIISPTKRTSSFINPLAHVLECMYLRGILFKLYFSVSNSNNRLWTGFAFNYSPTSFVFQAFRQWERLLSLGKCLELSV